MAGLHLMSGGDILFGDCLFEFFNSGSFVNDKCSDYFQNFLQIFDLEYIRCRCM